MMKVMQNSVEFVVEKGVAALAIVTNRLQLEMMVLTVMVQQTGESVTLLVALFHDQVTSDS